MIGQNQGEDEIMPIGKLTTEPQGKQILVAGGDLVLKGYGLHTTDVQIGGSLNKVGKGILTT